MKPGLTARYRLAKLWLLGYQGLRCLGGTHSIGGFRVLLLHDIPREQMSEFERLLRYVMDMHGVVSPEEAEARLKGKGPSTVDGRVPYLLTFDDGFKSNFSVASEILAEYGVKAIFFVCPGLIDLPRERQYEAIATLIYDGRPREGDTPSSSITLMSWSEIEAIVAAGHTIGSHSTYHRRLSHLSSAERQAEILGSADKLATRLGISVKWFAFPFGDIGSVNQASLRDVASGYQFCCSGIRGVNSASTHPLCLLREQIDIRSPFEFQRLVLEGALDFYYWKKAKGLRQLVE